MNGILYLLDQAGIGIQQVQQENEQLRARVAELEAQAAEKK